VPLDETARPRYEEAVDLLFEALGKESFSWDGTYFQVGESQVIPFPERKFQVTLGGTSDRTYELAAANGWSVAVPPLLPYGALEKQLDLYREKCDEHGTEPDIVWIHACHLDEDRDTALREAREWVTGFIRGNCSPLTEHAKPPAEDLLKADYGFYAAGIMESLNELSFEQLVEDDYVWVGTPDDIVERIEQTQQVCAGIKEIAITVNAGGAPHWMAIKNQELFAAQVIPRLRGAGDAAAAASR
jgi:alkanesulfonate monooxygenase SsuD/methylene tetrahydromethanopterin reductase-like flavin-dependent oxidoreductase (luciferase family)